MEVLCWEKKKEKEEDEERKREKECTHQICQWDIFLSYDWCGQAQLIAVGSSTSGRKS